jgi:tetratricopeptide (TPR) repeat protein
MELELTRHSGANTHVNVTCNSQPSHTFDLLTLVPDEEKGVPQPLEDPKTYGQAIYTALFPPDSPSLNALEEMPDRILIVTTDDVLDAIPWEYAHSPTGFLVQKCRFVRGLPAAKRIPTPTLDSGLHIVAIPSNPLDKHLDPLDIEGEWTRLREIIRGVRYDITLERTRPPTIEQMRRLVGGQHNRVVHFMGHGGRGETGALLCFEKENGALELIKAEEFIQRVRGTVFLVTLNACVSATPGLMPFSNLAASLIRAKVPYVLGMRFSVVDKDALAFSKEFYSELARGIEVEEALFQARLTLARSDRPWAIGVPVLYTALAEPLSKGFTCSTGTPTVDEHQPPVEATALPAVVGIFQGRIDEQIQLGTALTSTSRPPVLTIHGGGGQGKTSLAHEAVERFAHAWPAGVYAVTLENLPRREVFVTGLARFLGLTAQPVADPADLEKAVLRHLATNRTLIVLDNAETMYDAATRDNDEEAIRLAQLLQQLPASSAGLLVTSRVTLGWSGEVSFEIGGLSPAEGAALFRQSAPQRGDAIEMAQAERLSREVDGHPFSLSLLAGAFNSQSISLPNFIQAWQEQLLQAENKFVGLDHRQRKLFTSIETSVRSLDENLRTLLSKLWIFHAPFLPQTSVAIFDPENSNTDDKRSPILDRLYTLWQRGLLVRETATLPEGTIALYRLLPTMRPYIEKYLKQENESEELLTRFGAAYAQLVRYLYRELDHGSLAAFLALQLREDLERGASYVTGVDQGYYWLRWGWILQRTGDTQSGLKLSEQALDVGQGHDQRLAFLASNNMAGVYQAIGQPEQALSLYQQALPITREVHDRAGEATTLNNMALVYQAIGQPEQALSLYQQALPIRREVHDRAGEAATLNNMAGVYRAIGQPEQALSLYQQALPITREVHDRAGEATTLNNMALVYRAIGQPEQALSLYQQALPITREVQDRAGEAATLINLAYIYQSRQQYAEARKAFEQSIVLSQQISNPAVEAAGLAGLAWMLYQNLNQTQEAIANMERAIAVLKKVGLSYDAAGQSVEKLQSYLQSMHTGNSPGSQPAAPSTMPTEQIQAIVSNTIAVMTLVQEKHSEWREAIANALQNAQQRGADWQIEVDFFTAVLAILDGKPPSLPAEHPYSEAVAAIQEGIARFKQGGETAS